MHHVPADSLDTRIRKAATGLRRGLALLCGALISTFAFQVFADAAGSGSEWQDSNYHFADKAEAAQRLGTSDAFSQHLSGFDRSARLKTDEPVTEAAILAFAAQQALDWDGNAKVRVQQAIASILPAFRKLKIPTVDIAIVSTTGVEEEGYAFTRQQFIVLPKARLAGYDDKKLRWVIAHETFHIISRTHPELREQLYAVLGYAKGDEVLLPEDLRERRITNPDGPRNDHYIRVTYDGDTVCATPVLYSARDPRAGRKLFDYLEIRYALSWQGAGNDRYKDKNDPELVEEDKLDGLFEQIGKNTEYTMHPDEILADNFAVLVTGDGKVQTPAIQSKMAAVFAGAPDAQKPLQAADICK